MRPLWKDFFLAVFLGMVLPGLVVNTVFVLTQKKVPEPVPQSNFREQNTWTVKVRTGDSIEQMDLDKYLTRVVLAEMPASFEVEALKAQSVAARTYAQKASVTGGKHGEGSVCTDSACCQGYITEEAYLAKGGRQEAVDKVAAAAESTSGFVLYYGAELIEATYFSSSGGSTEAAVAVWGTDIPYLQAVASPEGNGAEQYTQTRSFTPEEFQKALGKTLSGSPEDWITVTTYTPGGGVDSMTIGAQTYTGTQLRSLLGLRSTAFTVEASATEICFTTRGYGHRVGLSQYGANAMAEAGSGYEEILAHYYPGTQLIKLKTE